MKLEVQDLSFSYGKKPVLQEVSFTLSPGEILCVLGPNGVGKSTLFRCVLGLQSGYGGNITLDGRDLRSLRPRELAKRIAYIPQFSVPLFSYTAFQTVLMGTTGQVGLLSSPGKAQEARAMEALERLGIGALRDRTAGSLSGGERQLLLLARALAQNSPLLVMDEPTASLDLGNAIRVLETVARLGQEGYGVMLSTHNPDQALRFGTRVLVLSEGRVRSYGPPAQAVTGPLLTELYGTPIDIVSVPGGQVCVPGVNNFQKKGRSL